MGEREKIITLEDREWRLSKVTALVGSNILRKYLGSGRPEPQEFLAGLSDEDYASIQRACLLQVATITNSKPTPIMMIDGRWAIEEPTSALVYALVLASLMFQLSDFFDEGALKGFDQVMLNLKPSNVPT